MRIAWATPWNERSAIARFSASVCRALAGQGHRPEIVRVEVGEAARLPPLEGAFPVHAPGALPPGALAGEFDAVVVNLGNHYPFHGLAPALLAHTPCVAVLHDASMGHFAAEWRGAAEPEPPAALLDRVARAGQPGRSPPHGNAELAPALAQLACGAVVHGPHYRAEIAAACPGPVVQLPLAYEPPLVAAPGPISGPLTVATVGHINANKRVDAVIRALGASPRLRAGARYRLIGPCDPAEQARLLRLAARVGAPPPEFTGWVPDAALVEHLAAVDVLTCLRHPVLEGGSASLVLALRSARPVLVSEAGVYAELPEAVALRCTPGEEAPDVLRHLEWVLDNPVAARHIGETGAAWALEAFAPGSYAARLVPFLHEVAQAAPAIIAARALGTAASRLGLDADEPAVGRAIAVLAELVGGGFDADGGGPGD
jgi:glycosyltransferase involved in cell wall biosynthesis